MAQVPNRTCVICGNRYYFCPGCQSKVNTEPWRNIYDSENCMDIANTWYNYRGKNITKEQAKKKMGKYPDILERVFKRDTVAANEIKVICDFKEEIVEPEMAQEVATVVAEEVVEQVDKVAEEKQQNIKKREYKKNK